MSNSEAFTACIGWVEDIYLDETTMTTILIVCGLDPCPGHTA